MKLFYRHFGNGSPVIILHGLFGLSDNWVTFGKRLGGNYRVIIPDLRNHGQSPWSDEFDFPSLANDVRELMTVLGLENSVILGHSLGGKTAALLALESPDLVSKLVVADISLRKYSGNNEHRDIIEAMLKTDISSMRSRSDVEKALKEQIPSLRIRQFLLKSVFWKDREHLGWRINLHGIKNNLDKVFGSVTPEAVYPRPALFIRGSRSNYIIDDDIPVIRAHFPMALIKTITGASHWVHADAPDEFYSIVSEFLGS